ncbi:hypothetical protein BRD17_06630 [Halobacteriales archaeon SW_7_68_16]|nr:MAG: hypothetical protein BRD17_06630 [Halobacteriales archaeon SW_7_68_16]
MSTRPVSFDDHLPDPRTADRAISPVVGGAILIGILVVIASLTGIAATGVADENTDESPVAEFAFVPAENSDTVTVTYLRGNELDAREVVVTVDGTAVDAAWGDDEVTAGDEYAVPADAVYAGDTVRVVWESRRTDRSDVLDAAPAR